MAEDLGSLASTQTGLASSAQPSSFAPPHVLADHLPDPVAGAAGVVPGMIEPSHGNAPGPSPADGVSTDIYDTQPEEPMTALAPWQGGVEV